MGFDQVFLKLQNGNDVRGAAIATDQEKKTLTPDLVQFICAGFLKFLSEKLDRTAPELRISIGHDSRLTAEALKKGCLAGLAPAHVYDCHLASTPSMFQSTVMPESRFDAAVMITASHLPYNRNGLKFFTRNGGLDHREMTQVLRYAAGYAKRYGTEDPETIVSSADLPRHEEHTEDFDLVGLYSAHMRRLICDEVSAGEDPHPLAGLHIVVDAGNGAAGFFASQILEPLGARTDGSICLEPDGTFPNHIPNPENQQAMNAIRAAVLRSKADLGVIFDCDGDRGAVVFSDGTGVNRNRLIALLSVIVSEKYPGSTVVTDSVTSDELTDFLENTLHLKHFRYKRGYKNVINKGIELNRKGISCDLAIETSGHGAFRENYFSDDGAYLSIRIICKLVTMKREGRELSSLIAGLRQPAEELEIRYRILDPPAGSTDRKSAKAYGDAVLKDFLAFARQDPRFHVVKPNYEGVRVAFDDQQVKGWLLVRQSLHNPELPINVESQKKGGIAVILSRVSPFFMRYDRLT